MATLCLSREHGKKRRRRVQDDVAEQNKADDETEDSPFLAAAGASVPAEVSRVIARSGFLDANDLGRFLFLTSKSIGGCLGREEGYRHLCHARYGAAAAALVGGGSSSLAGGDSLTSRSWEWLFRSLGRRVARRVEIEGKAPPAKHSIEDYRLVINIYEGRNGPQSNPVVSEVFSGEQLLAMLTSTYHIVPLNDPVYVGSCEKRGEGGTISDSEIERVCSRPLRCSAHLLRMTDGKGCCLFEDARGPFDRKNFDKDEVTGIFGGFHFWDPDGEVDLDAYGVELVHRMFVAEGRARPLKGYTGLSFGVGLCCSMKKSIGEKNFAKVFYHGLEILPCLVHDDDFEEFDNDFGLTWAHIFENIYGFKKQASI